MNAPLQGIFVPTIVPYLHDGQIDEEGLASIVRWLRARGVTGFYPNGSMGEFIRLSYGERRRVVEIVCREAAGCPVLAGAAEPNVDLVLDMCRFCADLGCRAVSITGPYYYKLTQPSIEAYFRQLAAQSPIDIIVYNIPAFANEISEDVLVRLALQCPRIAGTKDTSKDFSRFQRLLHRIKPHRPDFACLIGWEELLCAALFAGADGGTLSSAGVVPELVMALWQAAREDRWPDARRLQFALFDLFALMVNAPNFPEGFRTGYALRGFQPGRARFPLAPEELQQIEQMRGRLACLLADAGFAEAAQHCRRDNTFTIDPAGVLASPCTSIEELRPRIITLVRQVLAQQAQLIG